MQSGWEMGERCPSAVRPLPATTCSCLPGDESLTRQRLGKFAPSSFFGLGGSWARPRPSRLLIGPRAGGRASLRRRGFSPSETAELRAGAPEGEASLCSRSAKLRRESGVAIGCRGSREGIRVPLMRSGRSLN